MKAKGKICKRFLLASLAVLALALAIATAYGFVVASSAKLQPDKLVSAQTTLTLLDANGNELRDKAGYVEWEDIPADLANAFVAVEDKRFFRHKGIDPVRIGGAAIANVKSGGYVQGASTITCQLVKNTHLNNDKTLDRKIKEAKLAIELERRYSKEEILTMYLNVIYFGGGLYGVASASQGFFDKDVGKLTLAECASIAATTVNPARYSPALNPDNNRARRDMVLDLMYQQGYVTQEENISAKAQPVKTIPSDPKLYETYCANAIDEAERITGLSYAQLCQGYQVQTYCQSEEQQECVQTLGDKDSLTMIATSDGKILGCAATFLQRLGSVRRQIGSTIKPLLYACAIEEQILLPQSVLEDEPTTFGDYAPHNYRDVYLGKISATTALAKSSNVAACKVANYIGVDKAYTFCIQCGLPLSPKDKNLSLALGALTVGVTADELVSAYTILANQGNAATARFVYKILSPNGKVVYQDDMETRKVIRPSTAYLVSQMLQETVRQGTARTLGELQGQIAAKTGTVAGKRGNSDAWCVAYNSGYIALSWVGNLSMKAEQDTSATGGGQPCLAVKKVLQNKNYTFSTPYDLQIVEIDKMALQQKSVLVLCSDNTPLRYREQIAIPSGYPLSESRYFDVAEVPDAEITAQNERVHISLLAKPLYTYYVVWDNGLQEIEIDRQEGEGAMAFDYPLLHGTWRIYGVLHGKNDIVSTPKEVFIL